MRIVDNAFMLWEKMNQPRRAKARLAACSSGVDCLQKDQDDLPEEKQSTSPFPGAHTMSAKYTKITQ